MFGLCVFLLIYAFFIFYAPNFLGNPDNYIPANPLQTPNHIVPEWYLLPYYAILRSITFSIFGIPAKLLGVICSFGSLFMLFIVPWLDTSPVRSARFRPVYKWVFWLLVIDVLALGWVGFNPPEGIVVTVGQIATALLLHSLPDPVPADRLVRTPASAADQHRRHGARRHSFVGRRRLADRESLRW